MSQKLKDQMLKASIVMENFNHTINNFNKWFVGEIGDNPTPESVVKTVKKALSERSEDFAAFINYDFNDIKNSLNFTAEQIDKAAKSVRDVYLKDFNKMSSSANMFCKLQKDIRLIINEFNKGYSAN